MFPVIQVGTLLGTLQKERVKPASIRGPFFVSASTVSRSVPIRGAVRGGRLKMSARDAARLLGWSHQRVHQTYAERGRKTVASPTPLRHRR